MEVYMQNGITKFYRRLRGDESGAAMVEYSILIGLITAAVIASVITVGAWVSGKWGVLVGLLAPV